MPFIQLQFRRGTATQWTSANPVLADGELAIESDTSKFKIGNGFGSWNFLPYGGLVGPTGTIGNTVSIDISFNGNIFVGRDVSFGGNLTVRNDVSFNKELRVGGNINIRSGAASISSGTGALIVAGGVGVGGNLNVALDASFNNRLFVNKDVSFGAKLCVQSDVSFNGNTSVALLPFYTGNATITPATNQLVTKKYVDENGGTILLGANNVWTANNTFNGNTSVAILPVYTGNATITPAINQLVTKKYVDENGGTILLSGNNTWTANNTFNGSRFYVNADASFQNKLTVGDDVSLNARLFVGQDSSLNGNVFVRRNLVVGGDASFNDNMSVQSDSSFNNRLYVGRQIGVGVTANASYALDVLGNINLSGNLYLNDKLFSITSADISLNANLMVGADASFNGNVFMSKTLNLRKTVITGAATGSPTSIAATTAIVEITGSGASTAYFNLLGGSYAGQTLTIISATNGGGGGLYVNAVASNIIFNGSNCSQMRFSSAFQTVNFVWSADVSDWIVTSWQGVNFGGVSMNFGTYTSGDITLGAAGRVNINPSVGGMVVGSDSSLNGNLSVGGTDSSFNGNLYTGGYINAEGFIERFVNVASSSGTYTADFNNGIIIYVNAFSGSSTPTLSITNLPTVLNQSYVFTVVYSGLPTSTYFSALNINGTSVPVSGSVSLTAASSYYVHQFCIFFTDATNLGNNFVVQNFNSSAPLSLVSPLVSGNLSVNGNINLTGGNIFQNGVLFSGGGGGGVGTTGNSLSLSGNLYVGGDVSFNNRLTGNGDVSLNQRLFVGLDASINANVNVGGNINFRGNLFQNGVLFTGSGGGVGTTGNSLSLSGNLYVDGDVSFNNRLTGNGDVSLNRRLFVGGDVSFGGNLVVRGTTESTSKTTGALIVAGGAGIGGNVEVGGNVDIAFNTVSTNSTSGSLIVRGGTGITGALHTGGIVNVGSTAVSSGTGSGALIVAGGAGVAGAVYTGGIVNVGSTAVSTAHDSGALIVAGGVGVAGALNSNNNITTSGVITTTNSTVSTGTSTGAIVVNGGVGVGGNLWASRINVNLDSSMNGNLRIGATTASTSTSTGALTVAGGVGVGGNLNVGGNIQLTGILKSNNNLDNKKIALYEASNIGNTSATDFYGFGINLGVLRYQTIGGGANRHHFFSGTADGTIAGGKLVLNGTSSLNMANPPDPQPGEQYEINFPLLITSPKAPVAPGTTIYAMGLGVDFATGYGFISCAGNSQGQPLMIQPRANGNVGIGITTNPTTMLQVGGAVTAVSFNATSDYRIKQNVHFIIEDASFNVDVLKPVSYLNTQLGKPDIGFIAHEVQEHYPYLVNGVKDGEAMQTLNYTGIIGILVKEIQELKKRVRDLELRTP